MYNWLNDCTCPRIGTRGQAAVGQQVKDTLVGIVLAAQKNEVLQGVRQTIVIMSFRRCERVRRLV